MTIPVVDPDLAALADAVSYCGWHVAPEVTETLIIDGPSGDLLVIPTLRVVEISEVIEDGVSLDLTTLNWSSRGLVRKNDGGWWTHRYGGISVSLTHGYVNPMDFWSAVSSYRDRVASSGLNGGEREVVGPFIFGASTAKGSEFSTAEKAILDFYRLEPQ